MFFIVFLHTPHTYIHTIDIKKVCLYIDDTHTHIYIYIVYIVYTHICIYAYIVYYIE